jgi:hypothetical protein
MGTTGEGTATRTPPRTSTHHHCCEQLLAGWMGGANQWGHHGARDRADVRNDDMDAMRMMGSRGLNSGENEQTAGTTNTGDWGMRTRDRPKRRIDTCRLGPRYVFLFIQLTVFSLFTGFNSIQ